MPPGIQFLSQPQIEQIYGEALRLLAEVGYEIRGPALWERLLAHGLKTASDGRILFPAGEVEKAIGAAPRRFSLYDRDGQACATLGGSGVHFTPGSSALKLLDHRSGETRPANTHDFIEYIRLCDGLEHIA